MEEDLIIEEDFVDFYDTTFDPLSLFDEKRYTEQQLIGKGAFKEVFEVFDSLCNRSVALAVMN